MSMADRNVATFDGRANDYLGVVELQLPELALLPRFRGRWDGLSVLDIGIGAGRTSRTFAAIAGSYVGIEIAPRMLERARAVVPQGDAIELLLGDARDLSALGERRFDLVLFSFNGIDYVDHEERLGVLAQMRQHTAADGYCSFSSHSLAALPLEVPHARRPSPMRPLSSSSEFLATRRRAKLLREINAEIDLGAARRQGWTILRDEDRDLTSYYVDPAEQRRQLDEAGFELIEIMDLEGVVRDAADPGPDLWLHYLCKPR
ncbi:MAG TPA: class I SAM-dependent methyltransferase [Solirubrobacterales bacterium]|jgi:SAM-dependent methyltransferase|nr:class I SAM-dependent methyltransferase [Solirubrobacterales bacterium]